jgi:hypothetical protein
MNQSCNPVECVAKIFGCKLTAFIASLGLAAGAVISIAMGFRMTYDLVTLIGN